MKNYTKIGLLLLAGVLSSQALAQRKDLPQTTEDGLTLVDSKRIDVLYWREGATLAPYKRIALLDPLVAFRKDWLEDQNRDRRSPSSQVTAEDMERGKQIVAEEFRKIFTEELQKDNGYQIVDVVDHDVLLLRPAIVDLDVAAPDVPQPGRVRSYTTSAGAMTLYMEFFDAATSQLIGRAIDRRAATDTGFMQYTNSVTNRAEAERMLRTWARMLREALDDQWQPNR
jgi:hypothetical protein